MKRHSFTFALGLAILLFGVAGLAQAVPITYTQTGIASGTLGGSTFTNASILMTMIGAIRFSARNSSVIASVGWEVF